MSYQQGLYYLKFSPYLQRENKLYVYSEHTTTIIQFCSILTSHVTFYPTPSTTFSSKLSPVSTYVQLLVVSTFMPVHTTTLAEALASYSASTFSYIPARCLRSREWQPLWHRKTRKSSVSGWKDTYVVCSCKQHSNEKRYSVRLYSAPTPIAPTSDATPCGYV